MGLGIAGCGLCVQSTEGDAQRLAHATRTAENRNGLYATSPVYLRFGARSSKIKGQR